MKIPLVLMIFVIGLAQETYEVSPVVVTANRYPKSISEITRTVIVIDSTEIVKYASLVEVIKNFSGLDIKIRGDGVQADPNIRGSTFQQVLIMIDGIRVNDPQTGHHNLNIPVPPGEIERIEILSGTASSLYGSDACGGVINIITKRANKIKAGIGMGSFDYRKVDATVGFSRAYLGYRMESSDGYEPGYEYKINNIFGKLKFSLGQRLNNQLSIGYLHKPFGAKNFYAPFPSWEKNQAVVCNLHSQFFALPVLMLETSILYRTHIDTFVLNRNNPEFYANRHQTFTYGLQILSHTHISQEKFGYFVTGVEVFRDSINSTRLGKRHNQRFGIFSQIEQKFFAGSIILLAGIREDFYSRWASTINPQISLAANILPEIKLHTSIGSSFRAPTFTELYYQDPGNLGDSLLKPERAWEDEFGIIAAFKNISFYSACYVRKTENNIDWVKSQDETAWQVKNIGKTRILGLESSLKFLFGSLISLKTGISYIKIKDELPEGYVSKYALQSPVIKSFATLETFSLLEFNPVFYYYSDKSTRILINTIANKKILIGKGIESIFSFNITNLLDKKYEDFQGVPLPGRAYKIGVSFSKI
ncbi:MAG: TonB-dependent receptor plug domain-containing protein [bacterium]